MDELKRKASWPFWVLGALLSVAAGGVFLAILIPGILHLGDGNLTMTAPGEQVLQLDKPGTYTIFHEQRSVRSGRPARPEADLPDIRCTLTGQGDGREIAMESPWGRQTYTYGDRSGSSLMQFTIETPGAYTLAVESDREAALVVVHDFMGRLWRLIVTSGLALLGLGTVALVLFILAILRTVRNRRIDRAQAVDMASQVPPRL